MRDAELRGVVSMLFYPSIEAEITGVAGEITTEKRADQVLRLEPDLLLCSTKSRRKRNDPAIRVPHLLAALANASLLQSLSSSDLLGMPRQLPGGSLSSETEGEALKRFLGFAGLSEDVQATDHVRT